MKDPEDEAWDELEATIKMREAMGWNKHQAGRVKSFDDAFEDYLNNMGGPRTASNEEVRRHFNAGWVAGVRNEWLKERND